MAQHIKTIKSFLAFLTCLYNYLTWVHSANLPTAYLIYGGHVSDSADLEAVKAVCKVCLQPLQSTWGTGPHSLLKMISNEGHFGMLSP